MKAQHQPPTTGENTRKTERLPENHAAEPRLPGSDVVCFDDNGDQVTVHMPMSLRTAGRVIGALGDLGFSMAPKRAQGGSTSVEPLCEDGHGCLRPACPAGRAKYRNEDRLSGTAAQSSDSEGGA